MRGNFKVRQRLQVITPDDCGVSLISVFELLAGVERCAQPDREREKVSTFLAPLHQLPFDIDSVVQAAKVRGALEKAGQKIGPYDLLPAGQALALGVTLVTRNTREFARVPSLSLEDWE